MGYHLRYSGIGLTEGLVEKGFEGPADYAMPRTAIIYLLDPQRGS